MSTESDNNDNSGGSAADDPFAGWAEALVAGLKEQYRQGGLGDMKIKRLLEEHLQALLAPIRERRALYLADRGELRRILREGSERANVVTQQVLQRVRRALGLNLLAC